MTTRAEFEARRDAVCSLMTANPHRFDMARVTVVIRFADRAVLGFPEAFEQPEGYGTAHCIAGWALVHKRNLQNDVWSNVCEMHEAEVYLGLDFAEHEDIFLDFTLKTPEDAALALKNAPYITDRR